MKKTIYPDSLKIKAGELFIMRDSSGKRIYKGEKLASELGVPKSVAYYLEYKGRELLGTRPAKKEGKKRTINTIGYNVAGGEYNTYKNNNINEQQVAENFVENNVYSSKESRKRREDIKGIIIYTAIVTTMICIVAGTYIINWLVNSLA